MKELTASIKRLGLSLGFNDVKVTDLDLSLYAPYYRQWVARGFASKMDYMVRHGDKRLSPADLLPGAKRAIVVRMDYSPPERSLAVGKPKDDKANIGLIARYTLGRDYHKVVKKRLLSFQNKILQLYQNTDSKFRAFVDSAPVLEKPLAEKAGIGWQGKNGLIISPSGSWFFIGVLLTNIPLICDESMTDKCSSCRACFKVCPTDAIISEKQIDTKRCISYLTIENKGFIDKDLRALIGNRIFGCDDCQLICPWNKWAHTTVERDFFARRGLESPALSDLALLSQERFHEIFAGSAILRAGFAGFLRNVAVALGNSHQTKRNLAALRHLMQHTSPMVQEHAQWAFERLTKD